MAMPAVSVIMPVYNAESTVVRAVRSILDGTFDDLEMVVVDDGSTDGSVDAVESIDDSRIRLIRQPHQGVAVAANTAVGECRGRIIARMDADDWSDPNRLSEQLKLIETDGLDLAGSMVSIVDEEGKPVESMQRYERWINAHLDHDDIAAMRFVELPIVNPTVLARRELFELGFREGDFPEDYDWLLRVIAMGSRVGKVPRPLLRWTERQGRLTRRHPAYTPEAFDRCRRMHLLLGCLAGVGTVDLWGVGKTGKPWQRWLQSEGRQIRRACDIDPRKVGKRIHGVEVTHADEMPNADGTLVIIAVGSAGDRELITKELLDRNYVIGKDAWFVA